ncbi:MAG: type II toxin-antitoxin system HicA family toxin [Desulfomonilaceae bacterium]
MQVIARGNSKKQHCIMNSSSGMVKPASWQAWALFEEDNREDSLPPKVRELIEELHQAGFADRGGKGSHRNFVHPKTSKPVTISGLPGDDAKHYQIRAVHRAIEESKK